MCCPSDVWASVWPRPFARYIQGMRIRQGMLACTLCGCRYAALERRLGEVDRARAILVHASSLADPRVNPQFWADWNEFEVRPSRSCESAYQHLFAVRNRYCCARKQAHLF